MFERRSQKIEYINSPTENIWKLHCGLLKCCPILLENERMRSRKKLREEGREGYKKILLLRMFTRAFKSKHYKRKLGKHECRRRFLRIRT